VPEKKLEEIMLKLVARLVALMVLVTAPAFAMEGTRGTHLNGTESAFVGFIPAPGFYMLTYASHERLTSLRDNTGDRVPLPLEATVDVLAPVALWVTQTKVFGGQLAFAASLPYLHIDAEVLGMKNHRSGPGDIVVSTSLGYHLSEKIHTNLGFNVLAPTGTYTAGALVNLGRNYWNITPSFAISYVQAKGVNADFKVMYDYNLENPAIHYQSGQELHMDYALGYAFGHGWIAGMSGYLYQQVTDDKYNGITIPNARARAGAIGPVLTYHNSKNLMLTLKFQKDFGVRNRLEGTALKFKLSIAL
jgi:hypothetical protein